MTKYEKLTNFWNTHSKNGHASAFVLSALAEFFTNGLIAQPKTADQLITTLKFSQPSGYNLPTYYGDKLFQLLVNQYIANAVGFNSSKQIFYCVASKQGNIGIGYEVNNILVVFYIEKYDFTKGIIENLISLCDNTITLIKSRKDFKYDIVKKIPKENTKRLIVSPL